MGVHKVFLALFFLLVIWLAGKFLLPFLFPFLLGTALALASEPVVKLGADRLRLRRGVAAGMGVTLTLVLLLGIAVFLGALLVREAGVFADRLPRVAKQSAQVLESYLTTLSAKAPEPVGPVLTSSIHRFFQDGAAITDRAVGQIPGILTGLLGVLPGSAMSLGTGVLSGYFISARLPALRQWVKSGIPASWKAWALPALRHLKDSLGKWLIAQGKLIAVTYAIVALGLLLLGIPNAFAWALLAALVDAVPLLGTGTVLLPWALIKLLQGAPLIAAGMVGIYLVAMITRTALEPRFYGRHLGLDPLVMLAYLYFGYRLWGFWGIVISPLLAAATKAMTEQ